MSAKPRTKPVSSGRTLAITCQGRRMVEPSPHVRRTPTRQPSRHTVKFFTNLSWKDGSIFKFQNRRIQACPLLNLLSVATPFLHLQEMPETDRRQSSAALETVCSLSVTCPMCSLADAPPTRGSTYSRRCRNVESHRVKIIVCLKVILLADLTKQSAFRILSIPGLPQDLHQAQLSLVDSLSAR